MKKLITVFATISLTTSSLVGASAGTKTEQKQSTTNETAQDIANKLEGKTITLDPNFWLGKDIANYKEQLQSAIIEDGILNVQEVNYVSGGDLIFTKIKPYPNCTFTVSKDGQTVTAKNITFSFVNPAQYIANKIQKNPIKIDPHFGLNKTLDATDKGKFDEDMVKAGIITQSELDSCTIFGSSVTFNVAGWYGNINFQIMLHDGEKLGGGSGNATINASTGETTKQIADKITYFSGDIDLNYNFGHTHPLKDNLPALRQAFVNDKVVTTEEASVIAGVHVYFPPMLGTGNLGLIINDNNTSSYAEPFVTYV